MKAFIESAGYWVEEKDSFKILNSDCIFADSSKEAVDIINKKSALYPDFIVVSRYYDNKIKILDSPQINPNIGYKRGIELVKEHGEINCSSSGSIMSKWEKEYGNDVRNLGIVDTWHTIKYDPKKAKAELRRKNRAYKPIANYIQIYKIDTANWGMTRAIEKELFGLFEVSKTYASTKEKSTACNEFMKRIKIMNRIFWKYSYRQVEEFQTFKNNWKKCKPISAKQTYVTDELFDLMQDEIAKHKPRKRELKLKF